MRLWHMALIKQLSNQRLLGQHRECCALRGKGWGKPHSTVDYVFKRNYQRLWQYHNIVINEMLSRKMNIDANWYHVLYRGKILGYVESKDLPRPEGGMCVWPNNVYPEHDDAYLAECVRLLEERGDSKLKRTTY